MNRIKKIVQKARHRLSLRFLFYFIIILTIPMTGFGVSYQYWIEMMRQNVHQTDLSYLQLISGTVNNNIAEFNNVATQLWYDKDINNFLLMDNPENNTALIADVLISYDRLQNFSKNSRFISAMYIYSYYNGMTIGKNFIEIRRDDFWERWDKSVNSPGELKTTMFNLKGNKSLPPQVFNINYDRKVIPYLIPLQVTSYNKKYSSPTISINAGVLIGMIDSDYLKNILQSAPFEKNGGYALILDKNGDILGGDFAKQPIASAVNKEIESQNGKTSAHNGGFFEMEWDGEKKLVSYFQVSNGWRYVSVTPQTAVYEKIKASSTGVWLLLAAVFLIGAVVACFLAVKAARPINQIVADTGQKIQGSGDCYTAIRNYLSNLQAENISMGKLLENQNEMIDYSIFQRLLYGGFESEKEYYETIEKIGTPPIHGNIIPVVICVGVTDIGLVYSNKDQLQFGKFLVKEEIQDVFSVDFIGDVNHNTVVFLYPFQEEAVLEDAVEGILDSGMDELRIRLQQKYHISIAAYGGSCSTSVMEISIAFRNAMDAMDHLSPRSDGITWYSSSAENRNSVFYPDEMEKLLGNSIKNGDTVQAVRCLDNIFKENVYKRQLDKKQLEIVKDKLEDTVNKLIVQLYPDGVPEEIASISRHVRESNNIEHVIESIKEQVAVLCREADEQRNQSRKKIADSIIELVDKNYSDCTLSLTNLSEEVKYSEQYISTVFHEVTGEHFSKYLERKRLNVACSLMMQNEKISLEEVAADSGYGSVNAFRRAFKRVYHVTPGEFRTKGQLKQ